MNYGECCWKGVIWWSKLQYAAPSTTISSNFYYLAPPIVDFKACTPVPRFNRTIGSRNTSIKAKSFKVRLMLCSNAFQSRKLGIIGPIWRHFQALLIHFIINFHSFVLLNTFHFRKNVRMCHYINLTIITLKHYWNVFWDLSQSDAKTDAKLNVRKWNCLQKRGSLRRFRTRTFD